MKVQNQKGEDSMPVLSTEFKQINFLETFFNPRGFGIEFESMIGYF